MADGSLWSSIESSHNYVAYERLVDNKTPILKCSNSSDLYTVNDSSKGNKGLSNPIGLITADEVVMAGGVYGQTNTKYYLYIGQEYWTMSPYDFDSDGWNDMFIVNLDGKVTSDWSEAPYGVRPVINLASDVTLSGTGTASDPYIVEGAE